MENYPTPVLIELEKGIPMIEVAVRKAMEQFKK